MKFRLARFNTYLVLLVAMTLAGCHTSSADKKAPPKGYGALRLHLEANLDGTDKVGTVTIGRQSPFSVNVAKSSFVEEHQLTKASVVDDDMGGFALRVQFNREGTWLLEQYTLANRGRRIAVFAELEDFRWIAAPLITKGITDGVFTFTPDASREEAEKLALGLNKTIKKIRSQSNLHDPEEK